MREKGELRNTLEATLYSLKENFDSELVQKFGAEEEKAKLKEVIKEEIEWVDESAWSASKEELDTHMDAVLDAYRPIHNRSEEYRHR